jgi:LuxR family transcriptional activator of conjugal transfer of Ti plasmids
MSSIEQSFQEYIDAIQTAHDDRAFEQVATWVSQRLGFRWFAYLRIVEDAPRLISSYPKSWTSRYFDLQYQRLDPVSGVSVWTTSLSWARRICDGF